MKYYSRDNRPKRKGIETGIGTVPVLGYRYNETGKKELVAKGIKDRYAEAQEALPGVEIKTLLARYSMGDETALERAMTFYGDFTETPTSYIEALNIAETARESFNALPKEIKEQFNYNPEELLRALGEGKGKEIFGFNDEIIKEETENVEE